MLHSCIYVSIFVFFDWPGDMAFEGRVACAPLYELCSSPVPPVSLLRDYPFPSSFFPLFSYPTTGSSFAIRHTGGLPVMAADPVRILYYQWMYGHPRAGVSLDLLPAPWLPLAVLLGLHGPYT